MLVTTSQASALARGRSSLFALFFLFLLYAGCSSNSAPREPLALRLSSERLSMSPARAEAVLTLKNVGSQTIDLREIQLGGADWDGFMIQGERLPSELLPGSIADIGVRVHARSFRTDDRNGKALYYTAAHAHLELKANGRLQRIPIDFSAPSSWQTRALPGSIAALILLSLLFVGLQLTPRQKAAHSHVEFAISVAALSASLAFIPVGDALCNDAVLSAIGRDGLAQCREGLGGGPLVVFPGSGSLIFWWVAWTVASGSLSVRTPKFAGFELLQCFVAGLLLVPVLARTGLSSLYEIALTHPAATEWGIFTEPPGLLLALLTVAIGEGQPCVHPSPRAILRRVGWAAWITAIYLGAWHNPFAESLSMGAPHAALVALGALTFLAKATIVFVAFQRVATSDSLCRMNIEQRTRFVLKVVLPLSFLYATALLLLPTT